MFDSPELRHIDLFSGIGGFALAARWAGYRTEVFCERDDFCQKILNKHWPGVPVIGDIFDFDGRVYAGAGLLTGGFPCQPYSCAGKQLGDADDRALWPEMLRVITEVRPRWIVAENVAGFINMALDGVLSDLEAQGYETGTVVLPACAVNAPHRRDRVWIVAHTVSTRLEEWQEQPARQERTAIERSGVAPDPDRQPLEWLAEPWRECGGRQLEPSICGIFDRISAFVDGHFDAEPDIPRVAKGIPNRIARLKALGNAIVPQVAYQILRAIHFTEPKT